MSITINIDKKTISEKIGIWFLASQLLDEYRIENTGINQYHLYLWIKEYNKDCLEEDFVCKDSTLRLPSGKCDILNICRTKLKINKNDEQVLDNDFCLEFHFNNIIYHSTRTKLCDENGNIAADLQINDLDTELDILPEEEYITKTSYVLSTLLGSNANSERKETIKMSFKSYENKTPDELFEKFKKETEKFTKKGLRMDVYSLVQQFKINNDISTEFTNDNIQEAAIKHEKTQKLLNMIIKGLNEGIKYYKGDIEQFYKKINDQDNEIKNCRNNSQKIETTLESIKKRDFCLWEILHWKSKEDSTYYDWTPWYSTKDDQESGLKIAINDVWAYEIRVSEYKILKKNFQYHLKIIFYDHFGLDAHDVKKFGSTDDIFKIWYYLQHARKFGGRYKPFVTKWSYENEIKGML